MLAFQRPDAKLAQGVALVDSDGNHVGFEASPLVVASLDWEHYEAHEGDAFSVYLVQDVTGAGSTYNVLIVTPNTEKQTHLRYTYNCEAEFSVVLFEGTTVSANGTAKTAYNRNRNSASTAGTEVYTGPTVTSDGTQLREARVWSGGGSGGSGESIGEWILATNQKYLLRFTKAGAGTSYVSTKLWWYEHTPPA